MNYAATKLLPAILTCLLFSSGSHAAANKKSLAVSVTLQPITATMTEEEIDAVADKIIANVTKQTGGLLRE